MEQSSLVAVDARRHLMLRHSSASPPPPSSPLIHTLTSTQLLELETEPTTHIHLLHLLADRLYAKDRMRTMGWPYQFVDLTDAQKISRRTLLDSYGLIAQASAGLVLIVIQLYFVAQWARRRRDSSDAPSSPSLKHLPKRGRLNIHAVEQLWRRLEWWSGDSLAIFGIDYGTKGQVTVAACWTVWLFVLCFAETGNGKLLRPVPTFDNSWPLRLSPPHKAVWNRRSLSTTIPLSPNMEVILVSCTDSHKGFPRDTQRLPSDPWPHHHTPHLYTYRLVHQLLRTIQPLSNQAQRILRHLWYYRRDRFRRNRNNCARASTKMELSCLLRRPRRPCHGSDTRSVLPRPPHPDLPLRNGRHIRSQHFCPLVISD